MKNRIQLRELALSVKKTKSCNTLTQRVIAEINKQLVIAAGDYGYASLRYNIGLKNIDKLKQELQKLSNCSGVLDSRLEIYKVREYYVTLGYNISIINLGLINDKCFLIEFN